MLFLFQFKKFLLVCFHIGLVVYQLSNFINLLHFVFNCSHIPGKSCFQFFVCQVLILLMYFAQPVCFSGHVELHFLPIQFILDRFYATQISFSYFISIHSVFTLSQPVSGIIHFLLSSSNFRL